MLWPNDKTNPPSSSVEEFSERMCCQSMGGNFRVERSDGGMGSVEIEVFIDLIGHKYNVVLDA